MEANAAEVRLLQLVQKILLLGAIRVDRPLIIGVVGFL